MGCTVNDYRLGKCQYKVGAGNRGVSDTFDPQKRLQNVVTSVYVGRKTVETPVLPSSTPPPAAESPLNANRTYSKTTFSSSVFRYASNHSLAILHSNTTITSTTPFKHNRYKMSSVIYRNVTYEVEDLAVSHPSNTSPSTSTNRDSYITSLASTESVYQQLYALNTILNTDANTSNSGSDPYVNQVRQAALKAEFLSLYSSRQLHHQLFYSTGQLHSVFNV